MKKWFTRMRALAAAAVCMAAMVLPAFAAGEPGVSVPVKVSLSGTLPARSESFRFLLKADDPASPMPRGAENGEYTLTVTGAGTKRFPTAYFTREGVYTYTVSQVRGTNQNCTYDDSVYTLVVTAEKTLQGGLEVSVALHQGENGEKVNTAAFENTYKSTTAGTTTGGKTASAANGPKTGDESTPLLYALLTIGSLGVLGMLFLTRRRTG